MKVHVDRSLCQGHGMCVLGAPMLFVIDDDEGLALVITEDVPPGQEETVLRAVDGCPEQAISIERER